MKNQKETEEIDLERQDCCDTCGAKLQPGGRIGNHVRGEYDEKCDKCYGTYSFNPNDWKKIIGSRYGLE